MEYNNQHYKKRSKEKYEHDEDNNIQENHQKNDRKDSNMNTMKIKEEHHKEHHHSSSNNNQEMTHNRTSSLKDLSMPKNKLSMIFHQIDDIMINQRNPKVLFSDQRLQLHYNSSNKGIDEIMTTPIKKSRPDLTTPIKNHSSSQKKSKINDIQQPQSTKHIKFPQMNRSNGLSDEYQHIKYDTSYKTIPEKSLVESALHKYYKHQSLNQKIASKKLSDDSQVNNDDTLHKIKNHQQLVIHTVNPNKNIRKISNKIVLNELGQVKKSSINEVNKKQEMELSRNDKSKNDKMIHNSHSNIKENDNEKDKDKDKDHAKKVNNINNAQLDIMNEHSNSHSNNIANNTIPKVKRKWFICCLPFQ